MRPALDPVVRPALAFATIAAGVAIAAAALAHPGLALAAATLAAAAALTVLEHLLNVKDPR